MFAIRFRYKNKERVKTVRELSLLQAPLHESPRIIGNKEGKGKERRKQGQEAGGRGRRQEAHGGRQEC
jgi:hypothetical protein